MRLGGVDCFAPMAVLLRVVGVLLMLLGHSEWAWRPDWLPLLCLHHLQKQMHEGNSWILLLEELSEG